MLYLLVIGFESVIVKYICKCKVSKYLNVAEILAFISLVFLKYDSFMVLSFCKKPILKVVNSLYYFDLEAIKEFIIDKHYIFHGNNRFPSLFTRLFFLYIYEAIYLILIPYFLQKVWSLTEINSFLLSTCNAFIKQLDLTLTFGSQT